MLYCRLQILVVLSIFCVGMCYSQKIDVIGIAGENITFECSQSTLNDKSIIVQWSDMVWNDDNEPKLIFTSYDNPHLEFEKDHPHRDAYSISRDGKYSLTIRNLEYTDVGEYFFNILTFNVDEEEFKVDYTKLVTNENGERKKISLTIAELPECTDDLNGRLYSVGQKLQITCSAKYSGKMVPMKWFSQGHEIETIEQYDLNLAQLIVNKKATVHDDQAEYTCEFGKGEMAKKCSVQIFVQHQVRNITFSMDRPSLVPYDSVKCSAKGNPEPKIHLILEILDDEERNYIEPEIINSNTFTANPSLLGRKIKLTCHASNSVGKAHYKLEEIIVLDVKISPICSKNVKGLRVNENTELTCVHYTNYADTITTDLVWSVRYKDQQEPKLIKEGIIMSNEGDIFKSHLDITATHEDNDAVYICEIINQSFENKDNICEISIEVLYKPRDIRINPSRERLKLGEAITCSAHGNPLPKVELAISDENEVQTGIGFAKIEYNEKWENEQKKFVSCTVSNEIEEKWTKEKVYTISGKKKNIKSHATKKNQNTDLRHYSNAPKYSINSDLNQEDVSEMVDQFEPTHTIENLDPIIFLQNTSTNPHSDDVHYRTNLEIKTSTKTRTNHTNDINTNHQAHRVREQHPEDKRHDPKEQNSEHLKNRRKEDELLLPTASHSTGQEKNENKKVRIEKDDERIEKEKDKLAREKKKNVNLNKNHNTDMKEMISEIEVNDEEEKGQVVKNKDSPDPSKDIKTAEIRDASNKGLSFSLTENCINCLCVIAITLLFTAILN